MATQQVRQWGVTPPISMTLPAPEEVAANDDLIAELKAQNNFELPSETERRKQSLQLMQRVTTEFVKVVSKRKGLSQAAVEASGGKICTYGSYRLGVYGPGSDIDTLVVAPKHVLIEDFFSDFPPILERMSPPGAIEKLTPVPDAFVPLIKLEFSGISFDLIFARLIIPSIPLNLDLKNNDYLRGLDDKEVRSLNGTRVTDQILELVPQQKTFRLALRAIKLWAQRRAIYANIVGFPGGVAWAMLVARVCQLYPQATGSVIVGKFFRIMNKWAWPQPVLLKPIEDGPLQMKVWNPKIYHGDRFHLMPIITPAYPSMCATHNISLSTKAVILRELQRGGDIVDKIFAKQLTWNDLFTIHTFFSQDYKYYLQITSSSKTKDAQSVWSGLVESKLRHLVGALDRKSTIAIAHPFPKGFERIHVVKDDAEAEQVKNGSTKFQAKGTSTETTDETNDPNHNAAAENGAQDAQVPDTTGNGGSDSRTIYTTTYYIGLDLKPLEPGASRSLDISSDANIFKSTCTSWQGFQPGINDLSITHVRNFDLPDDVFRPEETKPTRPKKKVAKKPSTAVTHKRSIDAVDALEPVISAQIMTLHHQKHHQTYITNLNAALAAHQTATASNDIPALIGLQQKIKFNGGGHINHSLFWRNLAPAGSAETDIKNAPKLGAAIAEQWGSVDAFVDKFKQTLLGIQGSGWGWLIVRNAQQKRLEIVSTKDQDPPASDGAGEAVPLFGIDMWEHAYYLQYLNNKAGYVSEIWKVINWKVAEERFLGGIEKEITLKL
ncbi:poly(A) polymerase [Talaromyces islandicus]|uniref:Superoxide dismutase [Mn], mitochondrial n=1 Tax=Talaromyces islandicus TaxID=28573 RepID=A0A0U1M320_TALIS|nr:poly(A) polymerase [Talaromyces islandicus]